LATRADGIDDAEKFSSDVTNGYAVMFIQLMSVATVNLAAENVRKVSPRKLENDGIDAEAVKEDFLGPKQRRRVQYLD
jgi:hypothetical protein